jgi:hypothetical protein
MTDTTHGNKTSWPHRPYSERWPDTTFHKVDANTVPYGSDISRNGKFVWVAFELGTVVAVGATKDDVVRKYRRVLLDRGLRGAR